MKIEIDENDDLMFLHLARWGLDAAGSTAHELELRAANDVQNRGLQRDAASAFDFMAKGQDLFIKLRLELIGLG